MHKPNRQPLSPTQASSAWQQERRALMALLQRHFTGADWLQLSGHSRPLLKAPNAVSLAIETLATEENVNKLTNRGRLTELPEGCADLILCDTLMQQHPRAALLADELSHLLRPGGSIVISGAGSLRGRLAAQIEQPALKLQDIQQLFQSKGFETVGCHQHGSQPKPQAWQQNISRWQQKLSAEAMQKLPWALPLFINWAATRPGWVIIFADRRSRPNGLGRKTPARKLAFKPAAGTAATGHCRKPPAAF